jgi:hypothetical protein
MMMPTSYLNGTLSYGTEVATPLPAYPTSLAQLKELSQHAFMPLSLKIDNHRIPDELQIQWYPCRSLNDATLRVNLAPTLSWAEYILSLSDREPDLLQGESHPACLTLSLASFYQSHGILTSNELTTHSEQQVAEYLSCLLSWVLRHVESEQATQRVMDVLYRIRTKKIQIRSRWQRIYVKCSTLPYGHSQPT